MERDGVHDEGVLVAHSLGSYRLGTLVVSGLDRRRRKSCVHNA